MNCKPGDLVRYVGPLFPTDGPVYGWVGRVIRYEADPFTNDPAWRVEPRLAPNRTDGPFIINGDWIIDKNLRPIRPGESPEESTEAMKRLHDTRREQTA